MLVDRSSSGTNVIITFGVAGDAFRSDNDGTTWVSITGSPADLNAPGTSVSTNTLGYASTYDESVTNYMAFPTPDVIINGAADLSLIHI